MANFDKFITHLLKQEGGYANHPNDAGGCTNMGITIGTYRSVFGQDKTCEDLKQLSRQDAATIYKSLYWDKCKADSITDDAVAWLFVDFAVNSGVRTAVRKIQTLVGTTPDGLMGNMTLRAINKCQDLYGKLMDARKEYYDILVTNKPTQKVFYKGWLNRLKNWDEYITGMEA